MLKRKAIVLAVAGVMGAPIAALAQNVQVYGKLYPQVGMMKTSGASSAADVSSAIDAGEVVVGDLKRRVNLDASNSRIGFRGSEDLGGGLKAIFQIESTVPVDAFDPARGFATRDSFVGLSGGFGTIKLGTMDTVYKQLGDPIGILGISSGNFVADSAVLSQGPFDNINFHVRERNSFIYESPSLGGVTALVGYSIPNNQERVRPGDNLKRSVQSFGVKYEQGPLYVAAAHEIRKDLFAFSGSTEVAGGAFGNTSLNADGDPVVLAGVRSKDTATRGAVMWEFPSNTKVSLDVAQLQLKETGGPDGGFSSAKNRRWAVTAEQGLGNVKVAASYAKSDDGKCTLTGGGDCNADGFGGSQLNVGAMLSLSKRTGIFAIYSRLTNDTSAAHNNTAAIDNVSPGADITQAAVGVSHSF
jgi:predicted porin